MIPVLGTRTKLVSIELQSTLYLEDHFPTHSVKSVLQGYKCWTKTSKEKNNKAISLTNTDTKTLNKITGN